MGLIDGAISGLIGGIGNVVQSASQAHVSRENTDKTIAANQKLAEYQYSKDLEMWNKANAYNSPSAQMERYKAAGLNPNLIYGSGASAGNTATSLPKYQAPTVRYDYEPWANLGAALSQYADLELRSAQIDNLKKNSEIKVVEKESKELDNAWKGFRNAFGEGNTGLWGQKLESLFQKNVLGQYNIDFAKDTLWARVNAVRLANQVASNKIDQLIADRKLKMANVEKIRNELPLLNSRNTYYKTLNDYIGKQSDYYETNMLFNNFQKFMNSMPNMSGTLESFGKTWRSKFNLGF